MSQPWLEQAVDAHVKQQLASARQRSETAYESKSKRIKSGNMPASAATPLAILSTPKRHYCWSTPVNDSKVDRSTDFMVAEFELFIPANMYLSTAQGMISYTGKAASIEAQIMYIQWKKLLGYLAQRATEDIRVETAVDAMDDEVEEEPTDGAQARAKKRRKTKTEVHWERSPSTVIVTWETVSHRNPAKDDVGYRLLLREMSSENTSRMNKILNSFIRENTTKRQNRMKSNNGSTFGGKNRAPASINNSDADPTSYHNIDVDRYIEMCIQYNPNLQRHDEHMDERWINDKWHPARVLSRDYSRRLAYNLHAHPLYINPNSYVETIPSMEDERGIMSPAQSLWTFPCAPGKRPAVLLNVSVLNPMDIDALYLPHIEPDLTPYRPQIRLWCEQHKKTYNEETSPHEWGRLFHRSSHAQREFDIHALRALILKDRGELVLKYKKPGATLPVIQRGGAPVSPIDMNEEEMLEYECMLGDIMEPGYYVEIRHLQRTSWINKFFEVCSPTGPCPPSVQAIMRYFYHYLDENDNVLTINFKQTAKNLSRYANMLAARSDLLNNIKEVDSCHQDVILFFDSAVNVFSRLAMNIHHLDLGPPGVGKSFSKLLVIDLMVAGTHLLLTYLTPKALAVNGREMSLMALFLEDAPASTFGVKSGKGGSGGDKDVVNMFKQMLTSLVIVARSCEMDPSRHGATHQAEAGIVVFGCLNENVGAFDVSVLNRFCVTVTSGETASQDINSLLRPSLASRVGQMDDPVRAEAGQDLTLICNREQVLVGISHLLRSVAYYTPIEPLVGRTVFDMIVRYAAKHFNMNMEKERRDILRFYLLLSHHVMKNAVDMAFNNPVSPLYGKKYEPWHWAELEKYMVASTEMVMTCVGMLSRQFADSVTNIIINGIIDTFIPEHKRKSAIHAYNRLYTLQGPPPPRPQQSYFDDEPMPDADSEEEGYRATAYEPIKPVHPFNGRNPTKQQMDTPEWMNYTQDLASYEAAVEVQRYWMYVTVEFGTAQLPAMNVQTRGNNGPTQEDIIKHVAHHLSTRLPRRFLPAEIESRIRRLTTDSFKAVRPKYKVGNSGEIDLTGHSEDRPLVVLTAERMRVAIPLLTSNTRTDGLFQACQDVASILAAMAKKRGEDTTKYKNMIYGDTEPGPNSRHVWKMLRIDEHIEDRMRPRGEKLDDYTRVVNTDFIEVSSMTMSQNTLDAVNPQWADDQYLQRLGRARTPYSNWNMDLDTYAALKRADDLGLCEKDQHYPLSNDVNLANKQLEKYYEQHMPAKKRSIYPDMYTRRDAKKYADSWNQLAQAKASMFQVSTDFKVLRERQKTRFPVSMDADFTQNEIDASQPAAAASSSSARQSKKRSRVRFDPPTLARVDEEEEKENTHRARSDKRSRVNLDTSRIEEEESTHRSRSHGEKRRYAQLAA